LVEQGQTGERQPYFSAFLSMPHLVGVTEPPLKRQKESRPKGGSLFDPAL